ncbi:expressed unknown protein [Seminavis robusta]|uniref:tRNA pseudouridine synthase n=1 Tax=Seminavis robusta TaxID=568900 RepID=A0A9N8HSW1_9STRA|nr:expressed unknown protein [Seminavis robusta]|eukprot:Sro1436_g272450.1 n/a (313) ;mRNA; r:15251-16380
MGVILVLLNLLLSTQHSEQPSTSQHRFFTREQASENRQLRFIPDLFERLPVDSVGVSKTWPPSMPSAENRKKRTYSLVVSYYGPTFSGGYEWNSNVELPTVRATLTTAIESSLEDLLRGEPHHRIHLQTAGRTDAGVSAKANVFSFVSRSSGKQRNLLLEKDLDEFQTNLNQQLAGSRMRVHEIQRISLCTIQSASVLYWSSTTTTSNIEGKDHVPGFSKAWKESLAACKCQDDYDEEEYPHCLLFTIRANRFLKRMMRKLINGLLLDHGCNAGGLLLDGKRRFTKRLSSLDRSGNHPAPSEGLCLWRAWSE